MADSPPDQLHSILDLLYSTASDQCRNADSLASVSIAGGLARCIRIVNPDSLAVLPEKIDEENLFEASKCILGVLKLMRCPHSLEADQIQNLECKSIYPVVKWLVNDLGTQQGLSMNEEYTLRQLKEDLNEAASSVKLMNASLTEKDQRKACIINELQDLRDKIRGADAGSAVQRLMLLLESLKALKRQEANLRSNYDIEQVELEAQIVDLEAKASWDCDSILDDLDRSLGVSLEKLDSAKKELAAILREVLSTKRQLDDVPSQSELIQYECRLSELNINIGEKHRQTRKYFATYNALLEIKELMLKEISLLNSINSQFEDAITSPAGQMKLIDSMEGIMKSIQQKLEKVQIGLQEDTKSCDTLRERYAAAIADQRRSFTLLKTFQGECTRDERLQSELVSKKDLADKF